MRRGSVTPCMASILIAPALVLAVPCHAQIQAGCIGINYVGVVSSNPFTAQYRTTSTTLSASGPPKTAVQRESVARDSQGRIRFEKHGIMRTADDRETVTLVNTDGKEFTATREELGTVIHIFDCAAGKSITLQPGLRIAKLKVDEGPASTGRREHAYSAPFIPGPDAKIPPNMTIDELGTREIQGVSVRGVRTTTLGTESDGGWKGKPVWETELWVSDELAAQLLKVDRDLRAGIESRSELIEIRREEPDPTLFEVPQDYQINPELPPTMKTSGAPKSAKD